MHSPSPLTRLPVQFALYGGGAIAVTATAALVKYFLSRLAEYVIYPIPFLGGLLQSLELAELSNLLVFAILGLGFGILTRRLPSQWGQRLSAALLIVLVPFIFMISPQVRYDRWVQTVADQEQLSRSEAIALTNAYLDDRIQSQGWWGFYRYTARYSTLPPSQAEMQRATRIDARVQDQFAKVTGMGTPIVATLMTLCSWGLRLFYFVIAAIVTVSHFQEGLKPPAPSRVTASPPTPGVPPPAAGHRPATGMRRSKPHPSAKPPAKGPKPPTQGSKPPAQPSQPRQPVAQPAPQAVPQVAPQVSAQPKSAPQPASSSPHQPQSEGEDSLRQQK